MNSPNTLASRGQFGKHLPLLILLLCLTVLGIGIYQKTCRAIGPPTTFATRTRSPLVNSTQGQGTKLQGRPGRGVLLRPHAHHRRRVPPDNVERLTWHRRHDREVKMKFWLYDVTIKGSGLLRREASRDRHSSRRAAQPTYDGRRRADRDPLDVKAQQ